MSYSYYEFDYGDVIVALRKQRSLNQKELAKRMSIPATTLSNYENGYTRPSLEVQSRIAEALGMSDQAFHDAILAERDNRRESMRLEIGPLANTELVTSKENFDRMISFANKLSCIGAHLGQSSEGIHIGFEDGFEFLMTDDEFFKTDEASNDYFRFLVDKLVREHPERYREGWKHHDLETESDS